jgi:YegS/Rv2252/BmrU family lipid kinase
MADKSALFIINKFAGGGFHPKVEGKILDICAKHNVECSIEFTRSRGHATTLAQEGAAKKFDSIVAVGGDGTVNEVARALVNTNHVMGIVPKGSGNGLSRHLGIPLAFEKAVENIFIGKTFRMDTFTINNRLSLNVSGIGFDGHVANLFGKDGKRGLVGYTKLTLKEFLHFKSFPLTISIDGTKQNKSAFVLAIANSSQYGNNARIAPLASVTDELLHLSLLKKVPSHMSIPFMLKMFTGRIHQSSFCETLIGKSITINTSEPQPFHVDGEPTGYGQQFIIQVQPLSLTLVVPQNTNTY